MEFYQLEHFVALADEHSFTRAAERVSRTQAALSVSIRKLETEFGLSLVRRDRPDCDLTEVGLVVLDHARRLIALRDEMQRSVAEFTSLGIGHVRIAAHESAAQYLVPAPLAAFHRLFPDVRIETRLCNVDEVAALVREHRADLGLGVRQRSMKGLQLEPLLTDPLVLTVAPDSHLMRAHGLSIRDLGSERFFVHHLHTQTTDDIQRTFAEHETPFNVTAELWNFETIKQFVAAGSGVAILPLSVVKADLRSGRLATLPIAEFSMARSIDVVYRSKGSLLPAPARLLTLLKHWRWDRHPQRATIARE